MWAKSQDGLGKALRALGGRSEEIDLLEEAVTAHRRARDEWSREESPYQWAKCQKNLADALVALGVRQGSVTLLEEAVDVYRGALGAFVANGAVRQTDAVKAGLERVHRVLGEPLAQ